MKELVVNLLAKNLPIDKEEIERLVEIPPSRELGDYSFPCFALSKYLKKNPNEISLELSKKIKDNNFEKIESKGPYLNFFINKKKLAEYIISKVKKEKDSYGSSTYGKGKKIVIEMSSPNIAKPFGIGHLRSTIIGNSISQISKFIGFKVIKINYLGDWGTPFGKLIVGYKKYGKTNEFKKHPMKHLYEIYVKVSKNEKFEDLGREWFKKLESGDKEAVSLWKKFKETSLKEFEKIYKMLNVKFDVLSGESDYTSKLVSVMAELNKKGLIKESEGALIVDLERFNLGVSLIQKADGASLYATRDIAAVKDRYAKYKFNSMIYEVGAEQKLHFKQVFKILELLGYSWAQNCIHVDHGLYLDSDGKKFSTRKGKTLFMEDILEETKELAKKEIQKREKLNSKELDKRASIIALSAIVYGDLKNYRSQDLIFDIERFLSFEGNTGPYLLYSYARAKSILRKAKKRSKLKINDISKEEKKLLIKISQFPDIVKESYKNLSPNLIANYAFELSQIFNEFYHSNPVIGSEKEIFRLSLVESFSQTLKNSLNLLGIPVLERM